MKVFFEFSDSRILSKRSINTQDVSGVDLEGKNKDLDNDRKEEEVPEHLKCGLFAWRPDWLQKYNNPRVLLACVSWSTLFAQGFVVNGINNVNIPSLERRFDMNSASIAWMPMAYDITAGICALIFGYLGMFVHKGKLLGYATLVMAVGSFTMFLPHVLSGVYVLGPRPPEMCELENSTDFCDDYTEGGSSYLAFLILGQVFHGIGGSCIFTMAVPYLDENIKYKNTALYIGISMCFAAFGPAMGYILGGLFLGIYVDAGRVDMGDISITPSDPRWVGAWWIGYLIAGFSGLTVSLLYFCFPKQLPTAKKYAAERKSQAYKGGGDLARMEDENFGKSIKDIGYSLKVLFTNPTWILIQMSGIVESAAIVAFSVFLPKFLMFQFNISLVMAAVWAGVVVIPGAAGGQIIGGLIPRWLNLKIKGLLVQSNICVALTFVLVFEFLIRCDMAEIAGLSVQYFNSSISIEDGDQNLNHPCNNDCNCSTISYDPICGQDGIQYFTPCHAGCHSGLAKTIKPANHSTNVSFGTNAL